LKGEYVDKFNEEMKERKKKGKSTETEPVLLRSYLPRTEEGH